jgi:hypothetical protein
MAYVPGYETDIFISYSHTDNDPLIKGTLGWVSFFEDLLRKRLRVRIRPEVRIFRDTKLQLFGEFSEQLTQTISKSAVFMCILSPGYVGSEWCTRELREFLSGQGSNNRIIKVVKTAFDGNDPNGEVQSLLKKIEHVLESRFYKIDESSELIEDLEPEVRPEHISQFFELVEAIAQNLEKLFKQLIVDPQPPHPPPITINEDAFTIYLAETTKDLSSKRDEIRTELLQYNCNVLPNEPLPQDGGQLITKISSWLSSADLSVHLIGANYGAVPEEEQRSVPQIQYDVAAALSKQHKLPQLIWMPESLTPADERQQHFIANIRNSGAELLQNSVEDLKTEIHKKLKPPPPNFWGDDSAVNVSLFCHDQDMESVAPLYSYLTVSQFFRVKFPLRESTSLETNKLVTQTSDAVILYYGTADEEWFVTIWKLIQRQISAVKNAAVVAKAIYAGKPATIQKDLLESSDPIIIKNYGQFTPTCLNPFLARIKEAKGGAS